MWWTSLLASLFWLSRILGAAVLENAINIITFVKEQPNVRCAYRHAFWFRRRERGFCTGVDGVGGRVRVDSLREHQVHPRASDQYHGGRGVFHSCGF